MEKTISAAEANRKFSALLRGVREGHSYVVTSHGRPVARIVPSEGDVVEERRRAAWEELKQHLQSRPALNLGRIKRDEAYDD